MKTMLKFWALLPAVAMAVTVPLPEGARTIDVGTPEGARTIDVGTPEGVPTLEAALGQVSAIRRKDRTTPLVVRIAPGDYMPVKRLDVSSRMAATNFAPLVICAAEFAKRPRIHGGQVVKGWTKVPFNGRSDVWCADVSALDLPMRNRLFFYNGRRMQAARYPNVDPADPYRSGWAFAEARGQSPDMWKGKRFAPTGLFEDEIYLRAEDRRAWANPADGWLIVFPRHNWWNRIVDVSNAVEGVVRTTAKHQEIADRLFIWDRWCIENVAEELDRPGEWYLDPRARKLYFAPPDGSDPNHGVATIPWPKEILRIGGANVTVAGLELAGGTAGIRVDHADDVQVLGCSVHDIGSHGGNGIWVMGHRVRVADCDVFNIGGHGIFVCGYPKENRVEDRLDVTLENNYVHHCGQIHSHGIGIWITGQGVQVRHNLVHDMPRCGIFGYGRFCEISYNRIRHVNISNDDTGAIYGGGWTQGVGTKVCYNWISDSIGFQRQRDGSYRLHRGACGIYEDEGGGGLAVYGNLVENCHHVAMHLHNGRWTVISNNVFVSNAGLPVTKEGGQFSLGTWNNASNGYFVANRRADIAKSYHQLVDADPRWRQYPALGQAPDDETTFNPDGTTMMGVEVKNNIFYYPDQGQGGLLKSGRGLYLPANPFDRNVYWSGNPTNVTMGARLKDGDSWAAWRAAGQDAESVLADPLFVDPARHDYRLRPESPARRLGFAELPQAEMGLRRSPYRPELPQEAEGLREHPEWLKEER